MNIKTLQLNNFRNYEALNIQPINGLNIFIGRNAQGKSALLESIYLLATSKSHRTSKDSEMIKIGCDFTRVFSEIDSNAKGNTNIEVIISKSEKKRIKINSVTSPKISGLLGNLNTVIFSSSDIDIIKGEPSSRRRLMNLEISQIKPQYAHSLASYKRVLEQRNALLKEYNQNSIMKQDFDPWDYQLSTLGADLISKRKIFIDFLSIKASEIYSNLSDSSEELSITYKSSIDVENETDNAEIAEIFFNTLSSRRDKDIAIGTTGKGPHRDDILIEINNISARDYGSQGQQRSAALSIKLAEIEVIKYNTNENPVVLLDDVMAELDIVRRKKVLELVLNKFQAFITATELDELEMYSDIQPDVYEVKAGTVSKLDK
ncbi:MAG: DNA replication/repair protein RecF [Armatimonadota bacterium]